MRTHSRAAVPQRRSCTRPPCCCKAREVALSSGRRHAVASPRRARQQSARQSPSGIACSQRAAEPRHRQAGACLRRAPAHAQLRHRALASRPKSSCSSCDEHRADLLAHHRVEARGVLLQPLERVRRPAPAATSTASMSSPILTVAVGHGGPQECSCSSVVLGARRAAGSTPSGVRSAHRVRRNRAPGGVSRTRRHSGLRGDLQVAGQVGQLLDLRPHHGRFDRPRCSLRVTAGQHLGRAARTRGVHAQHSRARRSGARRTATCRRARCRSSAG